MLPNPPSARRSLLCSAAVCVASFGIVEAALRLAGVKNDVAQRLGVPLVDVGVLGATAPPEGNEGLFVDSLHLSAEGASVMARQIVAESARFQVSF